MAFQHRSDNLSHDDSAEKSPAYGGQAQDGACACRPGSLVHSTRLHQVASGLANLRMVLCPSCLTPFETQEYQPIPGPISCDYGIDKPYAGEKRPSAQLQGLDGFMPTSITPGQPSTHVMDSGLAMEFVPSFQEMHMSNPVSPATTQHDVGFFSDAPPPTFYAMSDMGNNIPMSMLGLDGNFGLGSTASDRTPLIPYRGEALTTDIPVPTHMALPLAITQPAPFDLVKGYGTPGQTVPPGQFDGAKPSSAVILVPPNQKAPASKRGPFPSQDIRDATAETRRMGSCIRCRMQRIRCVASAKGADPKLPCVTCSKQRPNPKSWRLPCFRYKITDVKLFKPGNVQGKEWTLRWKNDVADNNITTWAEPDAKWIVVSEGYTDDGVQLRVKRFKPQPGDKLIREWASTENPQNRREVALPPYAVVDVEEAKIAYEGYIARCVGNFEKFVSFLNAVIGSGVAPQKAEDHEHLRDTYKLAWLMSQNSGISESERNLLTRALHLWVAIRLTTSSTTIIGEETLGIDEMPRDSPQYGKRPLPPVMGAQIDNILRVAIQAQWRQKMLELLQKMTQENKQSTWLTTYLITFILLHNTALLIAHDHRYAMKHYLQRRWAREVEVKEYMTGANILLSYFHYCNKGLFPFSEGCREQDLRGLAELDENKLNFVRRTRQWAISQKRGWDEVHRKGEFEDGYFWVSQLYTRNWERLTE